MKRIRVVPDNARAGPPLVAVAVLVVLLFGACSTYHRRSADIKYSFAEADYEDALLRIEQIDRGTSELLYLYEKALLLHYQDDYLASNEAFARAELLLEELYAKSVTRELAALAITDNIAKYRGETYEAVLVNYFKILNYLYLGDVEGALVECRRVNRKLEYLTDSEGVFFIDDPFIQYFTGMVYRTASQLNDADVSLRVAEASYDTLAGDYGVSVPAFLRCDRSEAARLLGEQVWGDSSSVDCPSPPPPDHGTLNLFLECGYVAHMQERNIVLPIFKDDDTDDVDALAIVLAEREGVSVSSYRTNRKVDYVLKIATPVLVPTPVPWRRADVLAVVRAPVTTDSTSEADDGTVPARREVVDLTARAEVIENLDAYAAAAFEAGYGKILFRTIVRGLAKYAAKEGASGQSEPLGWLVNWFNVATESADTRHWSTLPEKILMARLVLPEGTYDLRVDLRDSLGRYVDRVVIENVTIERGRTVFLNHRLF